MPGQRFVGEVGTDAAREQALSDPVVAPRLELALVLDEQPRKSRVVQIALLDEGRDRALYVV